MTGPEHYEAAELLLKSCQLGEPDADGTEYYAPGDDPPGAGGINTLANALAAAQVHATLALAAWAAETLTVQREVVDRLNGELADEQLTPAPARLRPVGRDGWPEGGQW